MRNDAWLQRRLLMSCDPSQVLGEALRFHNLHYGPGALLVQINRYLHELARNQKVSVEWRDRAYRAARGIEVTLHADSAEDDAC